MKLSLQNRCNREVRLYQVSSKGEIQTTGKRRVNCRLRVSYGDSAAHSDWHSPLSIAGLCRFGQKKMHPRYKEGTNHLRTQFNQLMQ